MKDFVLWAATSGNIWAVLFLSVVIFVLSLPLVIIITVYPKTIFVLIVLFFIYVVYRTIKDYRNKDCQNDYY